MQIAPDDQAPWHVMARGVRRLLLFQDDKDYSTFLQCLTFSLRATGCELWGFTLMTNHYHLVLYGSREAVSKCMYHADKMYAQHYNARYKMSGHVFDAPYKAFRIRSLRLALWTLAYVFLNPVKAGLSVKPEGYRWSGYRSFVGLQGSPMPVQASSFMRRIDLPLDRAWRRFYDCIRAETRRPPKEAHTSPTMTDVHRSQFEWLLEHAKENGTLLAGEDPREVAIYWGRQSGIAPRVMANVLGLEDSNSVRQRLHRMKVRLTKEPSLTRLATVP